MLDKQVELIYKGEFIECNDAMAKMYGYSKAKDFIGKSLADAHGGTDIPGNISFIKSWISNQYVIRNAVSEEKDANGNTIWFSNNILGIVEDNKLIRTWGTQTEITDAIKAKLALEKSEARLKEAQLIAMVGNFEHDFEKDTLWWSDETFKLLGFEKDPLPPSYETFSMRLPVLDRQKLNDLMERAYKFGEDNTITFRYQIPGCELKYIKAKAQVVFDENGKPQGLKGTVQDVTKEKMVEKELLVAKEKAEEANLLKTEFLHNMSHEVRTPMNGIIGFSEMLDDPNTTKEQRGFYSKIIQNSSKQLLRIIDDILEISNLETKQVQPVYREFSLNDMVLELFAIFDLKSKKRHLPLYLKKELKDQECYVVSDKAKLTKVIGNLLENAIKYTSQGYVEFGYYIDKPNLVMYVKDTGIGIAPKNHQVIFERFMQKDTEISNKLGGLGLGLSIAKESAQLLGGDITLESEKGMGATFYVTIPYKPAFKTDSENETETSIINQDNTFDDCTILVVEDEEVNYLYIETLLDDKSNVNFRLLHARNGKEAVEYCESNKNIDLILMDIKMPVMNGHEATKKIKSQYPHIPIIAQTAYSTESDKKIALDYGCDDFITKPINKNVFFTLMNKFLKKN
ncbi:MAG: response regulator [Bacteroidales bacterium]|nr:response regulator [Bacteroidales bacterium]